MGNILDFVDDALAVSRSEKAEMRADIAEGKSGGLVGWLEGEEYYIVYQPSGMEDWSIVGVVRASAVEAGMRKMQADTISLGDAHRLADDAGRFVADSGQHEGRG